MNARGKPPHALALRDAAEIALDHRIVTDGQGIVLEVGYEAALLVRSPPERLVRKPLGGFLAEEDRYRYYLAMAALARGIKMADKFEAQLARADGSRLLVRIQVCQRPGRLTRGVELLWLFADAAHPEQSEPVRVDPLQLVVEAQEDERRRLARDLHDEVGQTLTALALELEAIQSTEAIPQSVHDRLNGAQRLTVELGRQLRDLAIRIRPTVLDDLGLPAALEQLVAHWSGYTGITIDHTLNNLEARLAPDIETAIYRVVQEALTNAVRYAGADRIYVTVGRHERIVVAVEDNGIGFDLNGAGRDRLGIAGMRERVAILGGSFEIESGPGIGTTVFARIPIREFGPDG